MWRFLLGAALLCAIVAAQSSAALGQETPGPRAPVPPAGREAGAPVGAKRPGADDLKKYAGRYELDIGLLPISTLDVTIEGGELWVKPSLVKKRRLTRQSRTKFADEVEGTTYLFGFGDDGRAMSLTFQYEGESYTAARVELPPPSLKGNTTFRLKGYAEASVVALAGSFNNWSQSQTVCGREGDDWVCRLDLDPGIYAYKFIVDGNWLLDPANSETQEDAAGNVNNVVEIKPE